MSKKCIVCGSDLEDNAKFCDECGAKQEIIKSDKEKKKVTEDVKKTDISAQINNEKSKGKYGKRQERETSLRGIIAVVLAGLGLYNGNVVMSIIAIVLALTVLFDRHRKKGTVVITLLLISITIFLGRKGVNVINDTNNNQAKNSDSNHFIADITESISGVVNLESGTPLDRFIENRDAFEIYDQLPFGREVEHHGSEIVYEEKFGSVSGMCLAEFFPGEISIEYKDYMQLSYAEWVSEAIGKKEANKITEKLVKSVGERFGDHEYEYNTFSKEHAYSWDFENWRIIITELESTESYVTMYINYDYEYYAKENENSAMFFMEFVENYDVYPEDWLGSYKNEKGDKIFIDGVSPSEPLMVDIITSSGAKISFYAIANGNLEAIINEFGTYYVFGMSEDKQQIAVLQCSNIEHRLTGIYYRE